jgi:hypothetical protein
MLYNSNDFGKNELESLAKSKYVADNDEQGIAPHPGHLFKLLTTTDFMLLDGEHFLLLG